MSLPFPLPPIRHFFFLFSFFPSYFIIFHCENHWSRNIFILQFLLSIYALYLIGDVESSKALAMEEKTRRIARVCWAWWKICWWEKSFINISQWKHLIAFLCVLLCLWYMLTKEEKERVRERNRLFHLCGKCWRKLRKMICMRVCFNVLKLLPLISDQHGDWWAKIERKKEGEINYSSLKVSHSFIHPYCKSPICDLFTLISNITIALA